MPITEDQLAGLYEYIQVRGRRTGEDMNWDATGDASGIDVYEMRGKTIVARLVWSDEKGEWEEQNW